MSTHKLFFLLSPNILDYFPIQGFYANYIETSSSSSFFFSEIQIRLKFMKGYESKLLNIGVGHGLHLKCGDEFELLIICLL